MSLQAQRLPFFAPGWGRAHPWAWSIVYGFALGILAAGFVKYNTDRAAATAWSIAAVAGVFGFILQRALVRRPMWQPRWATRMPALDMRQESSRWVLYIWPLVVLDIFVREIARGVETHRPGQILLGCSFAIFSSLIAKRQWTVRRIIEAQTVSDAAPAHPPRTSEAFWADRSVLAIASPWKRLAARALDGAIVLFLASIITGAIHPDRETNGAVFLVCGVVIFVVLEVTMVAVKGQSPGKRMVGIQISRTEEGDPPGWGRSMIRVLSMLVFAGASLAIVGLFGLVWLLWDKRRQNLYDKAAGTLVLDRPKPSTSKGSRTW